jgi:hypothetical protein
VFLGGVVWISDYKERGLARSQGISEIEASQDRVWLAEVLPGGAIGELIEQPLVRSAYKNFVHSVFGLTVYQHRGFITQLPPGEYVSVWRSSYPGFPDDTATVHLIITPSAERN